MRMGTDLILVANRALDFISDTINGGARKEFYLGISFCPCTCSST